LDITKHGELGFADGPQQINRLLAETVRDHFELKCAGRPMRLSGGSPIGDRYLRGRGVVLSEPRNSSANLGMPVKEADIMAASIRKESALVRGGPSP
jgi:hypothetical protein